MIIDRLMDKILPTPPPERFISPEEMTSKDYIVAIVIKAIFIGLGLALILFSGFALYKVYEVFANYHFTIKDWVWSFKLYPRQMIGLLIFIAVLSYIPVCFAKESYELSKEIISDIKMLKATKSKE